MAASKRTTGAEEWRQTLPKRDAFQHSQNSARRSIMAPCQNRGPAKDERKTVRIHPCVGSQRRRRQQPGEPAPGVGRLRQVFEDVGSGASWNRPGLNRLKAALQPGDCVKVAALDRLGRSLTEVLGWLRENQVEVISLRESIDQDRAMGRAMLRQAIVIAEMERDLARERTLAGLERVKATGKHLGRRKGVSRKRAEEIQNMRQRDGLSWGRIATITGLPSSSIRRICTWDLEEIAPTAFGEG